MQAEQSRAEQRRLKRNQFMTWNNGKGPNRQTEEQTLQATSTEIGWARNEKGRSKIERLRAVTDFVPSKSD
jgi:hypothetical protein